MMERLDYEKTVTSVLNTYPLSPVSLKDTRCYAVSCPKERLM